MLQDGDGQLEQVMGERGLIEHQVDGQVVGPLLKHTLNAEDPTVVLGEGAVPYGPCNRPVRRLPRHLRVCSGGAWST